MKNIKFFPKSNEAEVLVPKPKPASSYVPEWYRRMPGFENNDLIIDPSTGKANLTAKMCMPFSDSFQMGYIVETWCDIHISSTDGETVNYVYSSHPQIMEHRSDSGIKRGEEFYDIDFAWKLQWIPQLPSGYSVVYTHPFNRSDLPFLSLTGIVDSDKFKFEGEANHPVFIKKGFSGIIPAGTPFLQIIPFKREVWESQYLEHNEKAQLNFALPRQKFWGVYKKIFWTKKIFR